MSTERIIADDVHLSDRYTLEVHFSYPRHLSRFFFEDHFRARYSVPIDAVPESLLTIPFLAAVLPFAWLFDVSVEVGAVDEVFAGSVPRVQAGFQALYPALSFGGGVDAREIEASPVHRGKRSAMLFSGGLDSITTYALHAEEHPVLITFGNTAVDLQPDETWSAVLHDVQEFARVSGTTSVYVLSNTRRMFNARALDAAFRHAVTDWWGGIQHGFGMAGLTAPPSSSMGLSTLYIASTLKRSMPYPWGSDPLIDDEIEWSGMQVRHDAYDLSRHEKIAVFGRYREERGDDLTLRVCNHVHGSERNCGRCEKCCRTMTGLVLSGIDPGQVGFPPLSHTHVARQLRRGAWGLPRGTTSYWTDLQCLASVRLCDSPPDPVISAHREYLEWLTGADFAELRRLAQRNRRRSVRFLAGLLPRGLTRVLEQTRRALGRT
ncbi:MAG: hypothetical protein JW733_00645 [Coriobacteriia bacterium]|nr:hypothetical protein [Coriobacteriia bacterium]